MVKCPGCGALFDKVSRTKSNRCPPCRRSYDANWRAQRKVEGNPVIPTKMPREWHQKYEQEYRKRPEVRQRLIEDARARRSDPNERIKHIARWKLNRALASGLIEREPCEVCRSRRSQAHHDDYSDPLTVRWLCARHHTELHRAKAEGKP